MEKENYKRVTITISKKITHIYDAEKKLLIPINEKNHSISINDVENPYFHLKLQLILPEIHLSKKNYVKKVLEFLSPSNLANRIIDIKKQNPQLSLKKILSEAEYNLIQEVSTKIIGTDDDPVRIYDFLSSILKETSKQMDMHSQEFTLQLTRELHNKGLDF
ncbi:MAG: hypothetical protein KatS3mg129_3319 [Leptospiraceae bacterium]|nr:MAG: hypothetical protein KatS3mg129_0213 [Leptospiraceae bacterium]GIX43586.1 MAG: hypothetical protein KatS3mg129_3319 [Leptospiraceae bacterium]